MSDLPDPAEGVSRLMDGVQILKPWSGMHMTFRKFFLQWIVVCIAFLMALCDLSPMAYSQSLPANHDDAGYSALTSLHSGLEILGRNSEMMPLISAFSGESTAVTERIVKIARSNGVEAHSISDMGISSLASMKAPVILHVKGGPNSVESDQYVLYIGQVDGCAKIESWRNPAKTIPFFLLEKRWEGEAIVLASQSGTSPFWARHGAVILTILALAVLSIAKYRRWLDIRGQRIGLRGRYALIGHACIIVLVSAGVAFAYNKTNASGLLGCKGCNAAAMPMEYTEVSFFPPDAPQRRPLAEIDVANAKDLVGKTGVLFIDARSSDEFVSGHIEGAINVPNHGGNERRLSLITVDKGLRIVVYCINDGCSKARNLASAMRDDGFQNVEVMLGGWEKWNGK